MTDVRSALVIGGGIAGPVTAMALQKAGIEATVHEAYPGPAEGLGGSLALAPNGVAALSVVDAESAVLDTALPITGQAMAIGSGHTRLPALADAPPFRMVRRGELTRALRELAVARGIPVEYGKRLVSVEDTGSGVTARFADGSAATSDVLVGADGVHSTVRGLIDPAAPGPRYTGLLGFEGVSSHDVPGADPGSMTYAFGARAYYLYWPLPGGGTGWGANLPRPEPMSLLEARAVPLDEWSRVLRETYADDDPGAQLVGSTPVEQLQAVGGLHIMPPVPHWYRGRMALVGDAVHAPSNSSGQGASLAIESAVELARCLRDLPDVPSAFAAYVGLRRARVEGVAARAARINQAKAPGPVAKVFMRALMPLMMRTAMNPERTLGHEQRFEIDWDAEVGGKVPNHT